MKEITKPVYYCEFCKKHGLVKHIMLKHEQFCGNNPLNFSKCSMCKNVQHEEKEFSYSDHVHTSQAFFCTAKQCGLIPLKARRKGLPEKYPETFKGEINMPSECDLFDEITY